jgi:hypothetical protein
MMWGSRLVGDNYDAPVEGLDPNLALIVKELAQHPEFSKSGDISLPKMGDATPTPSQGQGTLSPKQNEGVADPRAEKERRQKLMATAQQLGVEAGGAPPEQMQLSMPVSGNGWFETYFGKPAETLVKDLRMARRTHKDFKVDIDDAITAVRLVKRMEVDETLKAIPWSGNHENSMRNLGLSDRDLTALRKYATPREVSLRQACVMWERADSTIERLNKHEDVWGSVEQAEWLEALQLKKDAKKQWKNTLHQVDNLSKSEATWLTKSVHFLDTNGVTQTRALCENINDRNLTTQKLGTLLKMYGEDFGIVKASRSAWSLLRTNGTILVKDPWAYAAGFIDADGYITITKRGEPRAGIIATGERGRVHCENLHKVLGCGVLQLDLKIHKNSVRSQHRLQFYSKADLHKLLKGVEPHLHLKKQQARAVMELLGLGREDIAKARKAELQRIVKWNNWKDTKADDLLAEWGVDVETVEKWETRDPEIVQLGIEAERLMGGL